MLLAKVTIGSFAPGREGAAASATLASAGGVAPAACAGVQVTKPAVMTVTAGTAVAITSTGKPKTTGAPAGVRVDILPAGAAPGAAVNPACSIPVRGAIKAGATKSLKVPAKKLAACYNALQLVDCAKPLQATATAIAGKKFKEGPTSTPVTFTPVCTPCAGGRVSLEEAPAQQAPLATAPAEQPPPLPPQAPPSPAPGSSSPRGAPLLDLAGLIAKATAAGVDLQQLEASAPVGVSNRGPNSNRRGGLDTRKLSGMNP
jgi:hypothetical protein